MKKEYMLKRLVTIYNSLGVEVSVNIHGVVRLHSDNIKDDCYYSSITNCYNETFGITEYDLDSNSSVFYVLNSDGSSTPKMPF